jgi:hypothetical protein
MEEFPMRSIPAALLIALSLAFMATQPSLADRALVWSTGNPGGNTQGVANYIHGCYSTIDAINIDIIPLATLLNYDAVVYFSNNGGTQDPTQIGDVLADYADTGRRLVLCTFSWAGQGGNSLGGRIVTGQISPLLATAGSLYSTVTMLSNDGSGYFAGVNSVTGYYHDSVVPTSGATLRGVWSDGMPLLADKGNVVGVNLFPDDYWGQIGGDYQRLFQNALCWNQIPTAVAAETWGRVKIRYR